MKEQKKLIAKTPDQINLMRKACEITKKTLDYAETLVKPLVSTLSIDKMLKKFIINSGATPSFLGYQGFPASSCISVNDVVVHGIPSENIILQEGDILFVNPKELHSYTAHSEEAQYHTAVFSTSLFQYSAPHFFEQEFTNPIVEGSLRFPRIIDKNHTNYALEWHQTLFQYLPIQNPHPE